MRTQPGIRPAPDRWVDVVVIKLTDRREPLALGVHAQPPARSPAAAPALQVHSEWCRRYLEECGACAASPRPRPSLVLSSCSAGPVTADFSSPIKWACSATNDDTTGLPPTTERAAPPPGPVYKATPLPCPHKPGSRPPPSSAAPPLPSTPCLPPRHHHEHLAPPLLRPARRRPLRSQRARDLLKP